MNYVLKWYVCLWTVSIVRGLHIQGTFKSNDKLKLLARFGFQSTTPDEVITTRGYIYGNVSGDNSTSGGMTPRGMKLVVVDSDYLMSIYRGSFHDPPCLAMMNKSAFTTWDPYCNDDGTADRFRTVPCPDGGICYEEQFEGDPFHNYQFTYRIHTKSARFYYVAIAGCYRNQPETACQWRSSKDITVKYDIWLVNGSPSSRHLNPFEHQFSFERFDVLEIYIIFCVFLLALLILLFVAYKKFNGSLLSKLLFLIIAVEALELLGCFANLVHAAKFSVDGEDVPWLSIVADTLDNWAESFVVLILLLVAKGWRITFKSITRRRTLFVVWGIYFLSTFAMFIWQQIESDEVMNIFPWQITPGYITLGLRAAAMVWFLFELYRTHQAEKREAIAKIYVQFSAGFLVWFIYLPIVAFVSRYIVTLWRFKTILSFTCSADVAVLLLLLCMLWPDKFIPLEEFSGHGNILVSSDRIGLISPCEDESSEDEIYDRQRTVFRKHNNGGRHVKIPDLLSTGNGTMTPTSPTAPLLTGDIMSNVGSSIASSALLSMELLDDSLGQGRQNRKTMAESRL